jgi:hypothetical protein
LPIINVQYTFLFKGSTFPHSAKFIMVYDLNPDPNCQWRSPLKSPTLIQSFWTHSSIIWSPAVKHNYHDTKGHTIFWIDQSKCISFLPSKLILRLYATWIGWVNKSQRPLALKVNLLNFQNSKQFEAVFLISFIRMKYLFMH